MLNSLEAPLCCDRQNGCDSPRLVIILQHSDILDGQKGQGNGPGRRDFGRQAAQAPWRTVLPFANAHGFRLWDCLMRAVAAPLPGTRRRPGTAAPGWPFGLALPGWPGTALGVGLPSCPVMRLRIGLPGERSPNAQAGPGQVQVAVIKMGARGARKGSAQGQDKGSPRVGGAAWTARQGHSAGASATPGSAPPRLRTSQGCGQARVIGQARAMGKAGQGQAGRTPARRNAAVSRRLPAR